MSRKLQVSDERYSISLEFCGHLEQKHVLRFCGDFISSHDGRGQAEIAALEHCIARGQNRSGWLLLAKTEGVIWLRKGKEHRVAYGADITDFKGVDCDTEAAKEFGLCVRHSLECEGLLS